MAPAVTTVPVSELTPGDSVMVPGADEWGTVDRLEPFPEWPGAVLVIVDGQPYMSPVPTADFWTVMDGRPLF